MFLVRKIYNSVEMQNVVASKHFEPSYLEGPFFQSDAIVRRQNWDCETISSEEFISSNPNLKGQLKFHLKTTFLKRPTEERDHNIVLLFTVGLL